MGDFSMGQIAPQQISLPQNVTESNLGSGLAAGVNQGAQLAQQQQALALKKQQINTETNLRVLESLLNNGIQYPALLKPFWPAIANSMNSLNPNYKLDPNKPPENLKSWATQMYDVHKAASNGVITLPQADTAAQSINNDHFSPPMPGAGGNQPPQGAGGSPQSPVQLAAAGISDTGQEPGMEQPPSGQPSQPPQAPPPSGQTTTRLQKAQAAYAPIVNAAMSAPMQQVPTALGAAKNTPEGMEYESALEEQKQMDLAHFTQKQETLRSMMSSFTSQSDPAKQAGDNYNVLNSLLSIAKPASAVENPEEALSLAAQEKTAMMPLMQMIFPNTGRVSNQEMVENIEKTGNFSILGQQAIKRLFVDGQALTGGQLKAVRMDALKIYKAREQDQTNMENGYAQAIQANGGDPKAVFTMNPRPANAVSTSQFFPKKGGGTAASALIGESISHNGKNWTYLGGNKSNPSNWATE